MRDGAVTHFGAGIHFSTDASCQEDSDQRGAPRRSLSASTGSELKGTIVGMLLAPFRTRAAHIMTLGPIRISEIMRQRSPGLRYFHQAGALYDRVANQSRAPQNQNGGANHDPCSTASCFAPLSG